MILSDKEKDLLVDFFDDFIPIKDGKQMPIYAFCIAYVAVKNAYKDADIKLQQLTEAIKTGQNFTMEVYEGIDLVIKTDRDTSLWHRTQIDKTSEECFAELDKIANSMSKADEVTEQDFLDILSNNLTQNKVAFNYMGHVEEAYILIKKFYLDKQLIEFVNKDKMCVDYNHAFPDMDTQEQVRWMLVIILYFVLNYNYLAKKKNTSLKATH